MSAEPRATAQTQRCSICNPPHPRVGGMHLCYFDPLTEAGRGGSSPMSLPVQKCHPGTIQGLCRCLLRGGLCPPPPPFKACDHAIELHLDAKLPRGRPFPL